MQLWQKEQRQRLQSWWRCWSLPRAALAVWRSHGHNLLVLFVCSRICVKVFFLARLVAGSAHSHDCTIVIQIFLYLCCSFWKKQPFCNIKGCLVILIQCMSGRSNNSFTICKRRNQWIQRYDGTGLSRQTVGCLNSRQTCNLQGDKLWGSKDKAESSNNFETFLGSN